MITVTETVFKDDGTVEHTSSKNWSLKFRFLNEFKKLKGVSSFVVSDLSKSNTATFTIDGVKRKIDIDSQLYLGDKDND